MDWRMNYDALTLERLSVSHLQELRAEAASERAIRAGRRGSAHGRGDGTALRVRVGHLLTAAGSAIAGDHAGRHQPELCE